MKKLIFYNRLANRLVLLFALFICSHTLQAQIMHSYGSYCVGTVNYFAYTGQYQVSSWQVTGGGTIVSQGGNSVAVRWDSPTASSYVIAHFYAYPSVTSENISIGTTATPSVSISENRNNICTGEAVTFSAGTVNAGSPTYQWKMGDGSTAPGSTNSSTYTSSGLSNGQQVKCVVITSPSCLASTTVTSNMVTMAVTSNQTLSLSLTENKTTMCQGENITFSASTNLSSTFLWQDGSTGSSYVTAASSASQLQSVNVTAAAADGHCVSNSPATASASGTSFVVNPIVNPSISIQATPDNNVCENAQVTFVASPVNGGSNPSYRWLQDGSTAPGSTNSYYYTCNNVYNGQHIQCELTSNTACSTKATSNTITMNVTPIRPLSVTISGPTNVCEGSGVTFSALVADYTGVRNYQWKKNGQYISSDVSGQPNILTKNSVNNNDVFSCDVSPTQACCYTQGTSNAITITTSPVQNFTVSVSANKSNVCQGESVTFTANASLPATYIWPDGSTGSTFTTNASSIAQLNSINVSATTTATGCTNTSIASVSASGLSFILTPPVTPSVTINAQNNNACAAASVTFTATPVNGGSNPAYQWQLADGSAAQGATNSPTYLTTAITGGQQVKCTLTSSLTCTTTPATTSNAITRTVAPVIPLNVTVLGTENACDGTGASFTATVQNYTGSCQYQWKKNGQVISSDVTSNPANVLTMNTVSNNDIFTCIATPAEQLCFTPGSTDHTVVITNNYNYIREISLQEKKTDANDLCYLPVGEKNVITTYYDGLGRPMQVINWQVSPGKNDQVQPVVYDDLGRVSTRYLPYTGEGNGLYKTNALTQQASFYQAQPDIAHDVPYSVTKFDESPLNRVMQQGAPGLNWQLNSHPVNFNYLSNTAIENIGIWQISNDSCILKGTYGAGQLYVNVSTDENGSIVKEYKDKEGHVIMKSAGSSDGTLVTQTYYVYDDLGLLRYVLPPKAIDFLGTTTSLNSSDDLVTKYCYYYGYDARNRMITKQIPGAKAIYMVYDSRDRLVLTQDGKMRDEDANKYLFTMYDEFNRPVVTGIKTLTRTLPQLRDDFAAKTTVLYESPSSGNIGYTLVNSYPTTITFSENDILMVTFYDNYDHLTNVTGFIGMSFNSDYHIDDYADNDGSVNGYFDRVKGSVTGSMVKVLDGNELTGSGKWLYSVAYYDNRYRVIQSQRTLYDGAAGDKEIIANKYDFTGKVLQNRLAQVFNSATTTVDKYFTYDHAGRLLKTEQQIGNNTADRVTLSELTYNEVGQMTVKKLHGGSQDINYTYNIRGWLTQINDPDNLGSDLFAMKLLYNDQNSNLGNAAQHNGNISATIWNSATKSKQGYAFTYDGLNRLLGSDYRVNDGTSWNNSEAYEEKSIAYDKNGNIGKLQRTNLAGNLSNNFDYTYYGNKLLYLTDHTNNLTFTYTYDGNGNTTWDGIRSFQVNYNFLNLPSRIDNISYIYSASGEKLAKAKNGSILQYYVDNMVYSNNKELDCILNEEGLVKKIGSSFTYEYFLKDHLGSTRVVFRPGTSQPEQVTDYYPFGLSFQNTNLGVNKYLYNGKELQDETTGGAYNGLYDYGNRFYDPQIGRWSVIDGKAEKYYAVSPYVYAINNPIMFVDPNGKDIVIWYDIDKDNGYFVFNGTNAASAPNNAFVQNVIKAYNYDVGNGGGDNLKEAATNPKLHISVAESANHEDKYQGENHGYVFWDPYQGMMSENGLLSSPATALEHEFDHGVDDQKNPEAHKARQNQKDAQYDNAEERRVITGSEQKTAQANGEYKKGEVRSSHGGTDYTVKQPNTKYCLDYNPDGKPKTVQEIVNTLLQVNPNIKVTYK